MAGLILGAVLPALTLFYTLYYSPSYFDTIAEATEPERPQSEDPSSRLASRLAELLEQCEAQQQLLPPEPVRALLARMHAHSIAGVPAAGAGVGSFGHGPAPLRHHQEEEHPQEHLDEYMDAFYKKEGGEAEVEGLLKIFSTGLSKAIKVDAQREARRASGTDDSEKVEKSFG